MSITNEKNVTVKSVFIKKESLMVGMLNWDIDCLIIHNLLSLWGFNWDYKNTQDNSGLEGSISWQATPHVGLEAYVSNGYRCLNYRKHFSSGTDETFFD